MWDSEVSVVTKESWVDWCWSCEVAAKLFALINSFYSGDSGVCDRE